MKYQTILFMANKYNKLVNKTIIRLLTFLGIGSASFMFMACYGPAPQQYRVGPDSLDSLTVDSIYDVETDSYHGQVDDQTPR